MRDARIGIARGIARVPGTSSAKGNSQIVPVAGFAVGLDVKVLPHTLLRLEAGVVGFAGLPNGSRLVMIDRLFPMSPVWSIEAGGGILTSNEGSAAGGPSSTGGTYTLGVRAQRDGVFMRFAFTPITAPFATPWQAGRRFIPAVGLSVGKVF